jgi:hypothetical protein
MIRSDHVANIGRNFSNRDFPCPTTLAATRLLAEEIMPISYDENGDWKFSFVPEYADCIARVCSVWARLEYDVTVCIWKLADMRPAIGACVTSQIFTLQNRLSALFGTLQTSKGRSLNYKKN